MLASSDQIPGLLAEQPTERLLEFISSMRSGSEPWAIIFGAGLSKGAGIPDWKDLVHEAAESFGLANPDLIDASNYSAVLEHCEGLAPRPEDFWDLVTRLLCKSAAPTESQRHIATMPFELFVSLNYDCVLETHLISTGTERQVLAYPDINLRKLVQGQGTLFYVHGRCPGPGGTLGPKSVVLTRRGYDTAYDGRSDLEVALETIFREYNLLFVGTSLGDPDIYNLLRAVERQTRQGRSGRATGRKRLAFAPTEKTRYTENLEWSFRGQDFGIDPIFYFNSPGGTHSEFEILLRYLAEAVS